MPSTDQVSVVINGHHHTGTPESFREILAKIKDDLIVQAGKLEFAEADAKLRLTQIQTQQAEVMTLAATVKRFEIELETFVIQNTQRGM